MPEGSIRALIAMSLILIFAIIGIRSSPRIRRQSVVSTGVTQVQIDAMRADGANVVRRPSRRRSPQPRQRRSTTSRPDRDVQEAHDFGLQLMTTVSTLVVAVAGFYFGSRAVSQATKIVRSSSADAVVLTPRRHRHEAGARHAETQEAPGEDIEDELETTEEHRREHAREGAERPTDAQDCKNGDRRIRDDGDDDDERRQDLETTTPNPAATTEARTAEPPAQQPRPPQQPGKPAISRRYRVGMTSADPDGSDRGWRRSACGWPGSCRSPATALTIRALAWRSPTSCRRT